MFYLYVVIFFLWTALTLYLLLGGADFGAGVVEFFSGKKNRPRARKIMYDSMGAVWEANHMWLIIVIVVLFVGFPKIYAIMSTYMHIPLVIMLLGIIARGTAFSFRNYDPIQDDWHKVYDVVFRLSSLITPFFLGVIAASTVSGTIDPTATDFLSGYIFNWLTPFGCTVGIFTTAICGYLASSYSLAQVVDVEDQKFLAKKVKTFALVVFLSGALVFLASYYSQIPLFGWIFDEPLGQVSLLLATLSLILMFFVLSKNKFKTIRFFTGFQVVMILLAITYPHYPELVIMKTGNLSLLEQESTQKTIAMLAWALMLGSIVILPGVFHLIYHFNKREKQ